MLPKPRKGYLLIALVKNPFPQSSMIDLSELHQRNPFVWSTVIDVGPDSSIQVGQLVYHQRGASVVTPVLVENARELGLVHESSLISELPVMQAEIVERYGQEILERLHNAESTEKIATALITPNGSMKRF